MTRRRASFAAGAAAFIGAAPLAWAAELTAQAQIAMPPPIPFKAESDAGLSAVVPAVLLVLLLAASIWAFLRYAKIKGLNLPLVSGTTKRLRCVETLYLTPKLRVHLIEIDGTPALVTESGAQSSVTLLESRTPHAGDTKDAA